MNKNFCRFCLDDVDFHVVTKKETYPVKGTPIEIEATVAVCDQCGAEIFHPELDNQNLHKAFEIYKIKNTFIMPEDLIALRTKYGLSQRKLGRLLGWGEITIHRYEKCESKPTEVYVNLLFTLQDPRKMLEYLQLSDERLKPSDFKRLKERVESLLEENSEEQLDDLLLQSFKSKTSIYTGFREFDFEKIANVILFFAHRVPNFFKTKLMKCLWYADMLAFKRYTVGITGLQYSHYPHGPVPKKYASILELLEERGIICLQENSCGDCIGEIIVAQEEYDGDVFSPEEMEVLEFISRELGPKSATRLSDLSHLEDGYIKTNDRQAISYEFAETLSLD